MPPVNKILVKAVSYDRPPGTSFTIAADSGSQGVLNSATVQIRGGEGIVTSIIGNNLSISANTASTTEKGIAQFDPQFFTVVDGTVSIVDGFGEGPYDYTTLINRPNFGTAAFVNAPVSGTDAASNQLVRGDDSRLFNSRTPVSHTHSIGEITELQSTLNSVTGSISALESNVLEHEEDLNNPHGVTKEQVGLSNVDNTSDLNKPISTAVQDALNEKAESDHGHGNISTGGSIGLASGLPIITGVNGVLQTGQFGASEGTFAQGNDSRFHNARTPTAHASSHAIGGSDVISPSDIGASDASHNHTADQITDLAPVATSGDYNDLSNKPNLFSGDYNDLSNTPGPAIPTTAGWTYIGTNDPTNYPAQWIMGSSIEPYSFQYAGWIDTVIGQATNIEQNAFEGCYSINTISFPAAKNIGISAFQGSSISSITLPAATYIGDYAFSDTASLTSISLPAATAIEPWAFYNSIGLTSVSLPAASHIGDFAFYYCISLTSVSLPAATTIGYSAFDSCSSLTSVSLPAAPVIGEQAFFFCSMLTSVSLPAATDIGDFAFGDCISLTSISIPAATSIGNHAFANCTALTSISIPAATSIGNHAFANCTALTSISIPAATNIGNAAFSNCPSLTSISIPAATSIGNHAFNYCTALTSIYTACPFENFGSNMFEFSGTAPLTIYVKAGTPGWTLGAGQTIRGRTNVTVATWTNWPDTP